ncbi:antizyme inhibitor 2 isoform X2 [Varanus komodoensis]|uniref:antizyme inhibitor 2 isoform X2 n=1 Tax=Varanus komodoensis TaxID=61221 RepID=UPI001CF7A03E|nr:antizyme inhibitor 2 isoform X2 [Varanus komodoensis]
MARCLDESDIMMVEEGFTTRDLLENLLLDAAQPGSRKPFFVADLEAVVKKHLRLLKALPRIKPFYALKCNHGKGVVQMLAALGAGFGCTNKAEVELVKSTGVPSDRIICTSPCKQISLIRYAARQGLQLMTFDNEVELGKIARSHPSARMILCLAADDSRSSSRLSMKFGATLKTCRHLLETAKEMNVEVVGISLHTGGSCTDLQIITPSIADARLVFEMGAELGYKMHLLDIGGVFPGAEESRGRLEETAAVVNSALDLYFPEGCGVEIIAELGRYYVDSAFTLAVNIVAKREVPLPGSEETLSRSAFAQQQLLGTYRGRAGPRCRRPGTPRTACWGLAALREHGGPHCASCHLSQGRPAGADSLRSVQNGLGSGSALEGETAACGGGRWPGERVCPSVLWLGNHRHALRCPRLCSSKHHVSHASHPAWGRPSSQRSCCTFLLPLHL